MFSSITDRLASGARCLPAAALLLTLSTGCAEQPSTAPHAKAAGPTLTASVVGEAGGFTFTRLEVPGARGTAASGINARGHIVGAYADAAGRTHGYVLREGEFTPIDFPGASMTEARGIGPAGAIVGTFRFPGDAGPRIHGFMLTADGEFVRVSYPGHAHTMPQRILPDGTILGCAHDNDTMASMRGIVISRSGTDETDAFASMHNGATPDRRRIAGLYTNMMAGRTEGYVIDDGKFEPFVVPGAGVTMTAAWDVSPSGDVVGVFRDAAGFHGFLRSAADTYTTIDVPGATITRAFGINARGDIVGTFIENGKSYGFLARKSR